MLYWAGECGGKGVGRRSPQTLGESRRVRLEGADGSTWGLWSGAVHLSAVRKWGTKGDR